MGKSSGDLNFDRIPKFITRLYEVTSNDKYKGIGWTQDGLKVQVYDRDVFVKETLPLISKTREFGTFVRMLNCYGFFKSRDVEDDYTYQNRNFRRGREDLLGLNRCVKIGQRRLNNLQTKVGEGSLKEAVEYLYVQNQELYTELAACKERIERQERGLNGLIEIFSRVFRTNIQEFNVNRPKAGNALNLHNEMDMFLNGDGISMVRSDNESVHSEQSNGFKKSIPKLSFRPSGDDAQARKEEDADEYVFF